MCQYPATHNHREVWGRLMDELPGSISGRTHIFSTGTHVMERFIDVVFPI